MSFDTAADRAMPGRPPLQFVNIEITPLVGGQLGLFMQATLLDEQDFEFVGQELANAHVDTLDEAIALIRQNVAMLAIGAS